MAKLGISTGTVANDGTGDTLNEAGTKANSNFDEVYTYLGDGTNLGSTGTSQIVAGKLQVGAGESTGDANVATFNGSVNLNGGDIRVGGGASITGITTIKGDTVVHGDVYIHSGIVTAGTGVVTYFGDGANLTGLGGAGRWTGDATGISTVKIVGINTISSSAGIALTVNGPTYLGGLTTVFGQIHTQSQLKVKETFYSYDRIGLQWDHTNPYTTWGDFLASGEGLNIIGSPDGNVGSLPIRIRGRVSGGSGLTDYLINFYTSGGAAGGADFTGIVTAQQFSGDIAGVGATFTTVSAGGSVTANSFYGDGSNLEGVASSGIGLSIRETITKTVSGIGVGDTSNTTFTDGRKSYVLQKVGVSSASRVVLYTDQNSMAADAGRSATTDPLPGSGVIAEINTNTTGVSTFLMSPGLIGWNNDATPSDNIWVSVTNNETSTANITVSLTIVQLEA
tara:strand:+ start:3728 stop:5080 length:1353 start_codon:yes stop_codon:yes gene_type:complete